ncbi:MULTISPECIES: UDP-N-acetylmuramoyl-L-alanyl-D-glutamate--2,6-diaminopimelate ligase [Streptomyces]|uniref:UDP-N-acetylmuramoyl-L-alanyl-D-glutamate--2,6-diaminopimelate ligase n=1 Tax=Streptomyces viridochromogenes TaxID=1938 RepID=A0A0L8K9C8_STRVR|nr:MULTISPECIES: UDP-N-acetylmuramoyl-L-alanyl-D-glutamate--2,6-diaminopimelate ligase [Streptomyces]KOG22582.1 UDP-N-acetylmuramoylalanyl-D-glutamate--2,6-diaminopimelate ligase [Streptomyces viridochromogenes]
MPETENSPAALLPRPERPRAVPIGRVAELLGIAGATGDVLVTGITHSHSAVLTGDLYVALPDSRTDAREAVATARAAGAVAVLAEEAAAKQLDGCGLPVLVVTGLRSRLAELSSWFYGRAADGLLSFGVTGTNGKTTTCYLLEGGLRAAGRAPGLLGTVERRLGAQRFAGELTTPEAPQLYALLAVLAERGADALAMEVSSHALRLGRVDALVLDVAIFTNLTHDHLDFHPDMEDYYRAKAALFTPDRCRRAVVNVDDPHGRRLAAEAGVPVVTFSADGDPGAHWRAVDTVLGPDGSAFRVLGPGGAGADGRIAMPGGHNVANALGAIAALATAGLPLDRVVAGIGTVAGVPGRVERVDAGQPYLAVVDYAHQPDALRAVLTTLRAVTYGRLHVVVGCGGDRDSAKRPVMGEIAARFADTAVLTTDNPRSEDPLAILAAMHAGTVAIPPSERGEVLIVADRAEAIAAAVARADPDDTVLIAGKGHEKGQHIGAVTLPFDDRVVLASAIATSRAALPDPQ